MITQFLYEKHAQHCKQGIIPLVIEVDNLDIMASLLILKADVEDKIGSRMKMVFSGAMEAHLLAEEIGKCKVAGGGVSSCHRFLGYADVGVILNPSRPNPIVWDQRRV